MKLLIMLLVGFGLLIKGADIFVEGSSSLAKKFKIPAMIIGLTIVAMGTSAPEAAVSITSSLIGQNELCIANVVGSNMFNILIVLGLSSIITKLPIRQNTIKKDAPFLIGITITLLIMGITGNMITVIEGLILLILFIYFIWNSVRIAKNSNEECEDYKEQSMIKTILFIILGLIGIVYGGTLVVDSSVEIATNFGLSTNLVGLTVAAVGTSLPELVTSLTATRKGETEIAIGNVIGSNIFNTIGILGISTVLNPVTVTMVSIIDITVLLFVTILLFSFMFKKELNKKHGMIFVLIYLLYMTYLIIPYI